MEFFVFFLTFELFLDESSSSSSLLNVRITGSSGFCLARLFGVRPAVARVRVGLNETKANKIRVRIWNSKKCEQKKKKTKINYLTTSVDI